VDVLITNTDDPRLLFGIGEPGGTDAEAAVDTAIGLSRRFGTRVVAVTLRDRSRAGVAVRGAVVFAAGVVHRGPLLETRIVDPIGAGDAFSAGLTFGALQSGDWAKAVRYGTALSAMKHEVAGDFSAATQADVGQFLATPSGAVE
jgi:sugar/nucleoside kinase (ribokinase family)